MIKKPLKSRELSKSLSDKEAYPPPITIEIVVRSLLFNLAFVLGTTIIVLAAMPLLLLPKEGVIFAGRCWTRYLNFILKYIAGITYKIKGKVPQGAAFIASKHQSAWETMMFFRFLKAPACLMKKELFKIPILGRYFAKSGMIKVEREKSAFPLKSIIRQMENLFKEERSVIIFPEGTRVDPFEHKPYKPGIALMYEALGKEVIPVALNAGLFWGRRSFIKYPGTITVEFLDPIPAGLSPKKFLETLETTIEIASARLREEALLHAKKS